jgi:hypothetical protein
MYLLVMAEKQEPWMPGRKWIQNEGDETIK